MATITTHLLNGTAGTHMAGVGVSLFRIEKDDARSLIFESATDEAGRMQQTLETGSVNTDSRYELVIEAGAYWLNSDNVSEQAGPARATCTEIVHRFSMPSADARYHVPFILSPHSYSVWHSIPEQ